MAATETFAQRSPVPLFERYINKLRFVFDEVKVVFSYGAIARARDRWAGGKKSLRERGREKETGRHESVLKVPDALIDQEERRLPVHDFDRG